MGLLSDFLNSLVLIINSKEIWEIAGLSIFVSVSAVLAAVLVGIPIGIMLAECRFRNNILLATTINTGMGLPPVFVGLMVYLIFSRAGPLGEIRLLFTPIAMILAQLILTLPIIIGTTKSTLTSIPEDLPDTLRSMGASERQINMRILWESRIGILTGVALALGRAFSEVGAIIIVGGNIRFKTRVLTTSIITEISKGNNEMAIAIGILLLCISFLLTSILTSLQFRSS